MFGYDVGPILFGLLSGIAIMVGLIRPYLKLEDELERLSGIQASYDGLSHILKNIVINVKTTQDVNNESKAVYDALRQLRGTLGAKEDKPANRNLIENLQKVVNERYPKSFFWYPQ